MINTSGRYDVFMYIVWSILGLSLLILIIMIFRLAYGYGFNHKLLLFLVSISSLTLFIWSLSVREEIPTNWYGLKFQTDNITAINEVWDSGIPISPLKPVRKVFPKTQIPIEGVVSFTTVNLEVQLPYTAYVNVSNVFEAFTGLKELENLKKNVAIWINAELIIILQKPNMCVDQDEANEYTAKWNKLNSGKEMEEEEKPVFLENEIGRVKKLILAKVNLFFGIKLQTISLSSILVPKSYTEAKERRKDSEYTSKQKLEEAKTEAEIIALKGVATGKAEGAAMREISKTLIETGVPPEKAAYYAYLAYDKNAKSLSLVMDPSDNQDTGGIQKLVLMAYEMFNKEKNTTTPTPAVNKKGGPTKK